MCTKSKAFSRKDRVRKRGAFRRIQSRGQRVHTRHFVIVLDAGRQSDRARLGITVTKKIGHAPARNRVKRLVREFFRTHRQLFLPGLDVVFIAKRGAPTLRANDLKAEVHRAGRALRRAGQKALDAQADPPSPPQSAP